MGEEAVNVAAEINKLRGEMQAGLERINGRLGAGQQVMLSLDANQKRLEGTVKDWKEQAEKKCERCHGTLDSRLSRVERKQYIYIGAAGAIVAVVELAFRGWPVIERLVTR